MALQDVGLPSEIKIEICHRTAYFDLDFRDTDKKQCLHNLISSPHTLLFIRPDGFHTPARLSSLWRSCWPIGPGAR
jgi:hypothetical protein